MASTPAAAAPAPPTATDTPQPLGTLADVFGAQLDALLAPKPGPAAGANAPEHDAAKPDLSQIAEIATPAPTPAPEPPAPAEGPAAEPESEPAPEAKPDDKPEEGEAEPETEPETPKGVQKRIDKLTAQKKALEARLRELESGAPAVIASPDPVENLPEVRKLADTEAHWADKAAYTRNLLKLNARDPDGVAQTLRDSKIQLQDWSPEAVGEWLEEATEYARAQLNGVRTQKVVAETRARERLEVERRQTDAKAAESFKFLADEESEGARLTQDILKSRPWLQKDPAGLLAAAVFADWIMKAGKPAPAHPVKPKAPPPKLPGASRSAPPSMPPKTDAARPAFEQALRNPSDENLKAFLAKLS